MAGPYAGVLGWPAQCYALANFFLVGELALPRDGPALLSVIVASSIGLYAGDRMHRRMPSSAIGWAVILFLSVASIQMIMSGALARLALAAVLALLGVYVQFVLTLRSPDLLLQSGAPLGIAPADIAPWMHRHVWRGLWRKACVRVGSLIGLVPGSSRTFNAARCGRHRRLGTHPESSLGEVAEDGSATAPAAGAAAADDLSDVDVGSCAKDGTLAACGGHDDDEAPAAKAAGAAETAPADASRTFGASPRPPGAQAAHRQPTSRRMPSLSTLLNQI